MLSLHAYYMGRDLKYQSEWTQEVRACAEVTVRRINNLVDIYVGDTGKDRPDTWASGWRPQSVNDATRNAASGSKHLTAEAGDVVDDEARSFATWCYHNQRFLADCDLWMEHPGWTGGPGHTNWVHLQTRPPRSGNRVFIPSSKPAIDPTF